MGTYLEAGAMGCTTLPHDKLDATTNYNRNVAGNEKKQGFYATGYMACNPHHIIDNRLSYSYMKPPAIGAPKKENDKDGVAGLRYEMKKIDHVSQTTLLVDVFNYGTKTAFPYYRITYEGTNTRPTMCHGGRINIVFCDGHAAALGKQEVVDQIGKINYPAEGGSTFFADMLGTRFKFRSW
jgi:prepilin-type processing-associated H-X9-DG protein